MKENIKSNSGFTLAELMVASVLMVMVFIGILLSYIRCMDLNEMAQNTSTAISLAKDRLEQIRNTTFAQIQPTYNAVSFATTGLRGMGVSYVDDSNPNLLVITVSVSWRQKSGRIIGEDRNFNGLIDAGEDVNNNGMLDSQVMLTTRVFNE